MNYLLLNVLISKQTVFNFNIKNFI